MATMPQKDIFLFTNVAKVGLVLGRARERSTVGGSATCKNNNNKRREINKVSENLLLVMRGKKRSYYFKMSVHCGNTDRGRTSVPTHSRLLMFTRRVGLRS